MIDLEALAPAGSPERVLAEQLDPDRMPRHVAVIMDGNGRWAGKRLLRRVEGHRAGIRAVRSAAETAAALGLEVLTLYAFSTENWKRPKAEVMTLMELLKHYLKAEEKTLLDNDMRFSAIGRIEGLPKDVQRSIESLSQRTSACTGTTLQLALNYSGRAEIVDCLRLVAKQAVAGEIEAESIDEAFVTARLSTAGQPDPDLLIRTSGEQRISNFLLWQLAYTELHITEVLWPDFDRSCFLSAVLDYQSRERRFGGLIDPVAPEDVK